jgi:ATP-dependent RNA helicase RhlE
VSLYCLDEEGWLQDIERFTKQSIPRETVEGFGPEPGERAEPIAMGRQTIWGGAGKPPSRDVMQAAAKAARTEMMQRMRDNKGSQAPRGGGGGGGGGGSRSGQPRHNGNNPAPQRAANGQAPNKPNPNRSGVRSHGTGRPGTARPATGR